MCNSLQRFSLREVDLESIRRVTQATKFDFVESAVRSGRAFASNCGGYVIIGGEASLLPCFAVEMHFPRLFPSGDYADLLKELKRITCGFLWLDSRDYPVFDLVFRMRLTARGVSVLFEDMGSLPQLSLPSYAIQVEPVRPKDILDAKSMLSQMDESLGGMSVDAIDRYLLFGELLGGYRCDELVACVLTSDAGHKRRWVSAIVVAERYRGGGTGVRFMRTLLDHFRSAGVSAVGSVGADNIFAYRTLLGLGLVQTSQGWVISL